MKYILIALCFFDFSASAQGLYIYSRTNGCGLYATKYDGQQCIPNSLLLTYMAPFSNLVQNNLLTNLEATVVYKMITDYLDNVPGLQFSRPDVVREYNDHGYNIQQMAGLKYILESRHPEWKNVSSNSNPAPKNENTSDVPNAVR